MFIVMRVMSSHTTQNGRVVRECAESGYLSREDAERAAKWYRQYFHRPAWVEEE